MPRDNLNEYLKAKWQREIDGRTAKTEERPELPALTAEEMEAELDVPRRIVRVAGPLLQRLVWQAERVMAPTPLERDALHAWKEIGPRLEAMLGPATRPPEMPPQAQEPMVPAKQLESCKRAMKDFREAVQHYKLRYERLHRQLSDWLALRDRCLALLQTRAWVGRGQVEVNAMEAGRLVTDLTTSITIARPSAAQITDQEEEDHDEL